MQNYEMLLKILKVGITGEVLDLSKDFFCDENIFWIYEVSKQHDLAHFVGNTLGQNGLIDLNTQIGQNFAKQISVAFYRYAKMQYDYENICKILNEAHIPFVPLKGAVIRSFYPEPWLRTSCDIDILIKSKDLKRATKILTEKGLTKGNKEFHDISFFTESGTHLELHFNLNELDKNLDSVLNTAWDYAKQVKDYEYNFTNEFFVFHLVSHMACHFKNGGCGIKTVFDLWLVLNNLNVDEEKLKKLLQKAKIEKFYESVLKLIDVWFMGGEKTQITDTMQDYIINGGVYGTIDNRVSLSMTKKSGIGHIINRLFPTFSIMKSLFPSLERHKILLPYFYVKRILKIVFKKEKAQRALYELKSTKTNQNGQVGDLKNMLDELGLN